MYLNFSKISITLFKIFIEKVLIITNFLTVYMVSIIVLGKVRKKGRY